ncbi:hypothetical protein [Ochrobactrum sp. Marseille-Q0166]|uniref:hypothetical protein n=1 Tax=Ochrobactrum sp. Marseille-Q0166 TaxID=2761105 RepID=UPI001FFFAAD9|nr:hypothetical protein [Ochrobactrum sp. Marseille-Q0166]
MAKLKAPFSHFEQINLFNEANSGTGHNLELCSDYAGTNQWSALHEFDQTGHFRRARRPVATVPTSGAPLSAVMLIETDLRTGQPFMRLNK